MKKNERKFVSIFRCEWKMQREGTRERANDKHTLLRTIIDNICVVPRNSALNLFPNEPLYDMKTISVNCPQEQFMHKAHTNEPLFLNKGG